VCAGPGEMDDSYVIFSENGRSALVRREWRLALARGLLDGTGCRPVGKGGRGEVMRFPFGDGWAILRRHQRGGLIRHVLRDTYLFTNRPLREFATHVEVHSRGLSVPEPLGVRWQRVGPCFRGAIATREVEGEHLLDYLKAAPDAPDDVLASCGKVIRRMHDLGCWHADLQLRNILVGPAGAYIIDFDHARLVLSVGKVARARNLLRLRRSMDKNYVPLRFFEPICEGYGVDSLPNWLDRVYAAKGKASDAMSGRR